MIFLQICLIKHIFFLTRTFNFYSIVLIHQKQHIYIFFHHIFEKKIKPTKIIALNKIKYEHQINFLLR